MVNAVTSTEPRPVRDGKVKLMEQTSFADIHVGDILMVGQGEIAPCDLLVLATSDTLNGKQVCQVDTYCDDGRSLRQEKDAISLTKNINHWTEDIKTIWYFLVRFTGKVTFQADENKDSITGNIKLRSDPKVERFDDAKIIKRGTILRSKYIIGLVLFISRPTFEKNSLGFSHKKCKVEETIRSYIVILIVIGLVLGILQSLFHMRIHFSEQQKYFSAGGIASHFSNNFSLFPFSLLLIMNSGFALYSVILEIKYNKLAKKIAEAMIHNLSDT